MHWTDDDLPDGDLPGPWHFWLMVIVVCVLTFVLEGWGR